MTNNFVFTLLTRLKRHAYTYHVTTEIDMATRSATTPEQKLAEDLAYAYRGFMRGCDTGGNFDIWYYGTKLIEAQDAIGFDLVDVDGHTRSLIASAYSKLREAVAPHKPLALDSDVVVIAA
jgi:hypothetical protein